MRTIAHLSDLHFGRIDVPVLEGLKADLRDRHPALLVVSGDFTQRARPEQFEQAAAFLRELPGPQLVVPGNHDVPLWDVARRIFAPHRRYQWYISSELMPMFEDDELFVIGVNTARSFTRTSGWISRRQLRLVAERACAAPRGAFKVLVTHHPFIPPPRRPDSDIVVGGARALRALEQCGIDAALAGHLHLAYHDDVRAHHRSAGRSVLSVQAGTATSTRRRGEPNAYNWITISRDLLTVAVRAWNGHQFEESLVTRYERSHDQWRSVAQVPVDRAAIDTLHMPAPVAVNAPIAPPDQTPTAPPP